MSPPSCPTLTSPWSNPYVMARTFASWRGSESCKSRGAVVMSEERLTQCIEPDTHSPTSVVFWCRDGDQSRRPVDSRRSTCTARHYEPSKSTQDQSHAETMPPRSVVARSPYSTGGARLYHSSLNYIPTHTHFLTISQPHTWTLRPSPGHSPLMPLAGQIHRADDRQTAAGTVIRALHRQGSADSSGLCCCSHHHCAD
jgi:hypothetical protein